MQIELGWSWDCATWGDATAREATRGRLRQGPRGLLSLLQGRLGLSRPAVPPVVRTTQYLRLIEQHRAGLEDPSTFWPEASSAVDPWSTAAHLLQLRDAAIAAGWRPGDAAEGPLPPRLAALAELERRVVVGMPGTTDPAGNPATLSPGPADDLREVLAELETLREAGTPWPLGIDAIAVAEEPSRLPGSWPRLLEELALAGVAVTHAPSATAEAPEVDVVECGEEFSAADVAARFLRASFSADRGSARAEGAAAPEGSASRETLTVLATADTTVLDQALRRRGLPPVGLVDRSADRAPQQLLGLFLDVAIAPVDVHQLAALLDLRVLPAPPGGSEPVGLVPAATRRRLLQALTREPGVGGPAWRDALERLERELREAAPDRRAAAERAREAGRALDRLVTAPLDPEALRPAALEERLGWLVERLRAVARGEGELLAVLTQVATLREVLGLLDPRAPLRRRTLAQIIEATTSGGTSPLSRREVTPWTVVGSPAQVRPGSTVLWWAPGDDGIRPAQRWDPAETAALTAAGAHLLGPEESARLQVEAAGRGLRTAERVIAVLPGRIREQPLPPSGLLADLETATGAARRSPTDLLEAGQFTLGGRRLSVLHPGIAESAPARPAEREITAHGAHLLPERLSFTQVDTLLGCPHHWMLEHRLGVRPAAVAALPTGSRMIGTLVHAVVETLVQERRDPERGGTPLEAPSPQRIGAVFDALVPQLASELDLPGRAAERAEVRARAIRSLHTLFTRTARAGLRLTGSEQRFELPLEIPLPDGGTHPVTFVGSRDLDARDDSGSATVLDLKWSRSRRRYGDLFDTGEAVQLASYAWAVGREHPTGQEPAEVGYFLLRSGEFVSANPDLDPRRRPPLDTADTWDRARRATGTVLAEIREGTVRIGCRELLERAELPVDAPYAARHRAVERARATARADGGLLVEDHCATSDYAHLCGLRRDPR